ncbi:MAG: leucyl/phenylalanyl-tRNA--protein transferase [Nocardioides sp.]|nr:leucyl/phenylalanyl-tRNA--protein transferase [Nocardioides sp.]
MPNEPPRTSAPQGPPVEPPPTRWVFGDAARYDPTDDLVGIGADLEPGTLLAAYRSGLFPMPGEAAGDPPYWFCPVERGVLPLDALVVSRSLRRSLRGFEIRVDTAVAEVIDACADPTRPAGWIDRGIRDAYLRLHELGWVHSVEAWRDGRLEGGLYGVSLGGLFAGESMFHRARDASKVALVGLVDLLRDDWAGERLVDTQWVTPHLSTLGVSAISRSDYLRRLPDLFTVPDPPGLARRRSS